MSHSRSSFCQTHQVTHSRDTRAVGEGPVGGVVCLPTSPTGSIDRRFRFRKSQRLRARRDFLRVQSDGARLHTRHFLLLVSLGEPQSTRLGVTVTKRVGHAVERNRVKRLVREAFRLNTWFPLGIDVVVIAKDGSPLLQLQDVEQEWTGVRSLLLRRVDELTRRRAFVPTSQPLPTSNAHHSLAADSRPTSGGSANSRSSRPAKR